MEQKILKIGLIYNNDESHWKSCNSILSNLIQSYFLTGHDIHEFSFSPFETKKTETLCRTIAKENLTHLVFVDHRIVPTLFLAQLTRFTENLPIIFIHIYGDFFINSFQWQSGIQELRKFKIKLISASNAQVNLVKKFLTNFKKNIAVIPFPVDEKFSFDIERRKKARLDKKFLQDDFILTYSGRISLQKNVLELISAFSFIAEHLPNTKLLIAGPFDDIGIPYLSLFRLPLTMETEFFLLIKNLPDKIKNNIFYLGDLNAHQLTELHNASDAYISFSTHNDEDYGMAPAEALCSGLPLFLTNWGGFMDFNLNLPNQVTLTDVNICKDMIKPIKGTKQKLFEFICRYKAQNFSQNSLDAKGIYSTDAIAKKISKLLQEDVEMFAGFNQYFDEMSQVPLAQFPFNNDQNEFNNKYEQLYDCYFNQGQS